MGSPERALFVGRTDELSVLRGAVELSGTGVPRVVLVRGAAGVGKTTLLDRVIAGAPPATRVLRAGASELESDLAFAVAGQLLADAGTEPAGDPMAVGASLLQVLGSGGHVVAVVEDVHWADRSSLAALLFAVRRLREDSVLVVLTCRTGADGVSAALDDTLRRFVDAVRGTVVELAGLAVDEVDALARDRSGTTVPRGLARRLRAHTDGNPLHLRLLLEEFPEVVTGPGADDDAVPLPAPGSVSELVALRRAGCAPGTRAVVDAAAVLGPGSPVEAVAELADVEPAEVPAAVDEGVRALLLARPAGRLREVRFAHPLVRAAVYHRMPLPQRRALHRRAAASPTGRGSADPDRLTVLRHEVAAVPGADAALADRVEAAADRVAARGAWTESARALLTARDVTPDGTTADRRLAVAAERLVLGGDVAEALALDAELRRAGDTPRRDYVLALLAAFTGRRADAEAGLARAWRRSEEAGDRALGGAVAAQTAMLIINDGRGEDTVRWARRAARLGAAGAVDARVMSMLALACLGRRDEALAEVAGLPARAGEVDADRADALLGRGVMRLWGDELDHARADLAAAADLFAARGPLHMRLIALYYLSETEYRSGRWDEAITRGLLAVSLAEDAEQAWTVPLVHATAAFALAGRGRADLAEPLVTAAATAAEAHGNLAGGLWAAMARARLAQARGDAAGLVAATDPLVALREADGWWEPGIQPWQHLRVEGLAGAGRLADADAALAALEPVVAAQDQDSAVLATTRARAVLELAGGAADAAEATCADRRDRTDAALATRPFEAALLVTTHGMALRRLGRRREAAACLERARAVLADLDAAPFVERCSRELAACGRTVTPPDRRADLTPQERAVAGLVAAGATNRDIAAELVISVKTVEYHLGRAFTKLGVRSRTALVHRLGVIGGAR